MSLDAWRCGCIIWQSGRLLFVQLPPRLAFRCLIAKSDFGCRCFRKRERDRESEREGEEKHDNDDDDQLNDAAHCVWRAAAEDARKSGALSLERRSGSGRSRLGFEAHLAALSVIREPTWPSSAPTPRMDAKFQMSPRWAKKPTSILGNLGVARSVQISGVRGQAARVAPKPPYVGRT